MDDQQPPTLQEREAASQQGLYRAEQEHDACGVGFIAHLKGQRSHDIVTQGLQILRNLDHRGAVGADELMGDGAGRLIQIPDGFYLVDNAANPQPARPARPRRQGS